MVKSLNFSKTLSLTFLFAASNFQSRFYLGEVGNGAAMKLVVNMIMGRFMDIKFILNKENTNYFFFPT